ncbi:hypothetical protein QY96_01552 [Bacillus thermotolerans]|nr:hypothetical protein QY96_01552 [Bacillus thermotolerans]
MLLPLVENYLLALFKGKLIVNVNGKAISKQTLHTVIDDIRQKDIKSLAPEFYDCLTSSDAEEIPIELETDTGDKELAKLYLLRSDQYHARISMNRSTGMRIFNKDRNSLKNFAGVLELEGPRLNDIFRKMEPPAHDKWDPELYKKDKKFARKIRKALYKKINESLRRFVQEENVEAISLKGLENILPLVNDDEPALTKINPEAIDSVIKGYKIKTINPKPEKKKGTRIPNPDPNPKPKPKPDPKPPRKQNARINNIRSFSAAGAPGIYNVVFTPETDGEAALEVKASGEESSGSIEIAQALIQSTSQNLAIDGEKIGPMEVKKGERVVIQLKMEKPLRYALEVNVTK